MKALNECNWMSQSKCTPFQTVVFKLGLTKTDVYGTFLQPTKDGPGLRTPGIYKIPCECGKMYIGQTGRSIQLRIKEHERHIRLVQPDKSAVAEHSFNHDRIIRLQKH